ncbi:2-dehydropantoate 2-reductase family protein [Penicillium antarcticum]|uniref:2-dehydropantoate 2-reductase family protein n=1 Tax=Penicillium antarcticum TaxID=416450 RepID=UPI002395A664|nr:2-dehydropantoate 2-reductase family protein [Penicillium antarcticum]KAJ5301917.1 2-dehydropantoate 2-reductase family protein [Penicillium antarcticum]
MTSKLSPIYVLGLGSIGSFIAHSLRSLPDPPCVTLLVHKEGLYQELSSSNWTLGLRIGEDGILEERSGFDAELLEKKISSCTDPIRYLIVAVKASATVTALEPFKARIGRETTICLFQNGLGQVEELNEQLFIDPSTRPTYMFGIVRHGVYLNSAIEAVLSGPNGCAAVGFVDSGDNAALCQHRFLLDALLRSPRLRCTELNWADLLRVQLLKLATNCVINPLTAVLDIRNGGLFDNPHLWPIQHCLLKEISNVFENLPEIKCLPRDPAHFSVASLTAIVQDTVEKTAHNSSSMREDIRKGRPTEIGFINGWIIKRGKELGLDCAVNKCVTQLILAKSHQGFGRTEKQV